MGEVLSAPLHELVEARELGEAARISGTMHPHRLRHTAATLLLAAEARGEITDADIAATLGGDGHDGAAFGLGAHESRQKIGSAGSGTCHYHGRLSGNTGVGVTSMSRGGFVPGYNEFDAKFVS